MKFNKQLLATLSVVLVSAMTLPSGNGARPYVQPNAASKPTMIPNGELTE